jgi:hypothetical protein
VWARFGAEQAESIQKTYKNLREAYKKDIKVIGYQIPKKVETFDSDTNNPRPPPHPPGGYEEDPLTKFKVFFKDNELY